MARSAKSLVFRTTLFTYNQRIDFCRDSTHLYTMGSFAFASNVDFFWKYNGTQAGPYDVFTPTRPNALTWNVTRVANFSYNIPLAGAPTVGFRYPKFTQNISYTGAYTAVGTTQ
jgi:hypothetical protein